MMVGVRGFLVEQDGELRYVPKYRLHVWCDRCQRQAVQTGKSAHKAAYHLNGLGWDIRKKDFGKRLARVRCPQCRTQAG